MKKLLDEMKKENNPYVTMIGQYLMDHLKNNPADADKLADTKKSIKGSLEAMRKEAEKKKVGNMAVLSDAEGFAVVCKYFGIKGKDGAPVPAADNSNVETDLVINLNLGGR